MIDLGWTLMTLALAVVLIALIFGAHEAQGRMSRGGMGSRQSAGAVGRVSPGVNNLQGFQGRGSAQITSLQTPLTFQHFAPSTGISVRIAPVRVFHAPVAPVFHHFPRPFVPAVFPRLGGISIVDVPDLIDVTIISGVAPGIGYGDPPIFNPVQQSIPGRSADQLAPFDPTPQEVVEHLLALAGVRKGDVVYDLGSGDGRVVIAAAKQFGVKAVGFEIDPGLVKLARENVRKQGVEKLVEIHQQDFMTANLAPTSVVTLYLSGDGNLALRPALMHQLKPGARVVSYGFDMGDWAPKIMETYRDRAGDSHLLYLW